MRTSENSGTPISYAVITNGKLQDNAFSLSDDSGLVLVINNKTMALGFDANDGEWHHVAVTWSGADGSWVAYKDGIKIKELVVLSNFLFRNNFGFMLAYFLPSGLGKEATVTLALACVLIFFICVWILTHGYYCHIQFRIFPRLYHVVFSYVCSFLCFV